MTSDDTIVAISSAVGPAARMILRLSGGQAHRIAAAVVTASLPPAATPRRLSVQLGPLQFPTWVYRFDSPRSVTGEDVIELHLPGNPLLARRLLEALVEHGARRAEAGEFTARAYFKGRIDLAQAEGVAATIAAQNDAELRAARQLLAGELARRLAPVTDLLAETLALIEAGIDFSDEDVSFLTPDDTVQRIEAAGAMLRDLLVGSARFEQLSHEPLIALFGRPNAGKSTLLNALSGESRAIVSPIAGTTRDALTAPVQLAHGLVRIADVAGVDESSASLASDAQASIAQQMHARALRTLESADLIVLVQDVTDEAFPTIPPRVPDLVVFTKADLVGDVTHPPDRLLVSAHTGFGLDALRRRLDELAFGGAERQPTLALNSRHLNAIDSAQEALTRARVIVSTAGPELIALELREALDQVGSIVGAVTPDDVLGRVFATFCIGK